LKIEAQWFWSWLADKFQSLVTFQARQFDDDTAEDVKESRVSHTVGSNVAPYNSTSIVQFFPRNEVLVSITDNNVAGVVLSNAWVKEGKKQDEYFVHLLTKPVAAVPVLISGDTDVLAIPTSLVFDTVNFTTVQKVKVMTKDDDIAERRAYASAHGQK
jgi:hypothetical protein